MELKDVLEYINTNKANDELQKALKSSVSFTLDDAMKDPNLGKAITSYKDSEISKAVQSFIDKTMPSKIEEEVLKRQQAAANKQPWETEIEKLKAEMAEKDRAYARSVQASKLTKLASEKGIPTELVEHFVGDTDEVTDANFNMLSKVFDDYSTKVRQQVLSTHNVKVPEVKPTDPTKKEVNLPKDASKEAWKEALKAQMNKGG